MTQQPKNNNGQRPQRRPGGKRKLTLWEALRLEIREQIRNFRLSFTIETEDLIKAAICGVLIIICACLQTTFFHTFAPFGAVPDIMLLLIIAIAAGEGEKYGAVCALISGFVINSIGGVSGSEIIYLLYVSVGYVIGILADNILSNTVATKALYVGVACFGRAIFTTFTAKRILAASLSQILSGIVVPEFFSTALISPVIYLLVWLSFKKFHKSRKERTEF